MTTPRAGITKTFLLTGRSQGSKELSWSDILAVNRDLENIFNTLQNLQTRRKEITGSRGGNAALASLLTALDELGIIKDSTT
jgi:hypothetical protein